MSENVVYATLEDLQALRDEIAEDYALKSELPSLSSTKVSRIEGARTNIGNSTSNYTVLPLSRFLQNEYTDLCYINSSGNLVFRKDCRVLIGGHCEFNSLNQTAMHIIAISRNSEAIQGKNQTQRGTANYDEWVNMPVCYYEISAGDTIYIKAISNVAVTVQPFVYIQILEM